MDLQSRVIDSPSRSLKMYAKRLEKLDIFTLIDFLYHIPSRYEDYSLISKIGQVQSGEKVTIKGQVKTFKNSFLRRSKTLQKLEVIDETGIINITFFNQPYLSKQLIEGTSVFFSGRVQTFGNKKSLQSPDYEVESIEQIHTGRLIPIYPETTGISSKWLRRQIYNILNKTINDVSEYLPNEIIQKNDLQDLKTAIWQVHFPNTLKDAQKAKERLAFDELLLIQLLSQKRRSEWRSKLKGNIYNTKIHEKLLDSFFKSLPFDLTSAQKRAIDQIFIDFTKPVPMNRLLEGDVGSGKTVVAAAAMYITFLNGFQSALMAPTEILAIQHFETISKLLSPLGVKMSISTSSKKTDIEKFDIIVGTHALLSKKINYEKLSLVVIDEQQRFGVEQRADIRSKGINPHLLTMTATPIPRTIALTLYGDLDLSFLDEMPKGRQEIKTYYVPKEKRESAYIWIENQINTYKSQAFIICPFIETSENMISVKAATVEFERLKNDIFPNLNLGLLHGKLKSSEKEKILSEFKNKKFDILVSTPVVEVGIDIPNATIMMIEGAERFGLAQIHQLRGRVGRGDKQSYCLLFSDAITPMSFRRLKAMEKIHIGSKLAELDLQMRGPGEVYGTAQSGRKMLKIASFSDLSLIEKTKNTADYLFNNLKSYPKLIEKIDENSTKKVAPD